MCDFFHREISEEEAQELLKKITEGKPSITIRLEDVQEITLENAPLAYPWLKLEENYMPRVFGIEELTESLSSFVAGGQEEAQDLAFHLHAALKSAVRAAIPGRQQQKNLQPLLEAAQKNFIRTLRRRAK